MILVSKIMILDSEIKSFVRIIKSFVGFFLQLVGKNGSADAFKLSFIQDQTSVNKHITNSWRNYIT